MKHCMSLPFPSRAAWARPAYLLMLVLQLASTAFAQGNYTAFELKRSDNFEPLFTEDMNGDGALDLVYAEYQEGIGRELLVYLQLEDGSFDATPVHVEVKTEIIAVGFADLRPTPGTELLLYANNGVYSLNALQPGYAGNIRQLVSWNLIASMPSLERVEFFDNVRDLNNDGLIDLILPGIDSYGIFFGKGDEQFELVSLINTSNESTEVLARQNARSRFSANVGINAEEGIVLRVTANARTPFTDFVEQWQEDTAKSALLQAERWMPGLITVNLNGDALLDLAYVNVGEDGLGQLNVHLQQADNGFAETPDWFCSVDTRGALRFVDINLDGLPDLLRMRGEGDESVSQFFLNRDGQFDLQKPDQVMRFSGYDVRLNFLRLEAGAAPVLNVSYYTIPVVDAIRNASINRIQLLYGNDQAETGQLFNRRPDSRLEESFSAANVRGLSEQMSLRFDVDGDGRNDALYITDNGTLAARRIEPDLQIAATPFWEYVSTRSVFQFDVLSLNADSMPDLILRHGTATSVLVGHQ